MAFDTASAFVKVSMILVIVGIVIHVIGFATNHWSEYDARIQFRGIFVYAEIDQGLWKSCRDAGSYSSCFSYNNPPGWLEATQAFETLGFLAAIAALVLIILYVFVPQTSGKKIVFILSLLACFAAAGTIILGIIIYGANSGGDLSWSFALCTIAGIIFGVSGILLVVDMLKR